MTTTDASRPLSPSASSSASRVDSREWRRLAGPILVGGAACSAVAALAITDEDAAGIPCPWRTMTGTWCPGCGLTRGTRALLHGDVVGALGHNILLPIVITAIACGWWAWWRHARRRPAPRWSPWLSNRSVIVWWASGALVVAFTVARNLPFGAALAP